MAHLRLFANLRELAGASTVEIPGDTVQQVLDEASARFGTGFRESLDTARVWVNGEPADPNGAVGADDEVAVLPPVSGGSEDPMWFLAPLGVAALLLLANISPEPVWFLSALVAAGAVWAWDLAAWGRMNPEAVRVPLLVAVLAGVLVTYASAVGGSGTAGLGVAVAIAVIVVLLQALLRPEARDVVDVAAAASTAVIAALGTGSLVLARIFTAQGQDWVWAFLAMMVAARAVSGFLATTDRNSLIDPLSGSVIAAVVTGIGVGLLVGLNGFAMFLVAIVVSVGMITGAAFSSLLRTGDVYFTGRLPGMLSDVGVMVTSAVLFLPIAKLLLT